jgi:hypothetical protein
MSLLGKRLSGMRLSERLNRYLDATSVTIVVDLDRSSSDCLCRGKQCASLFPAFFIFFDGRPGSSPCAEDAAGEALRRALKTAPGGQRRGRGRLYCILIGMTETSMAAAIKETVNVGHGCKLQILMSPELF